MHRACFFSSIHYRRHGQELCLTKVAAISPGHHLAGTIWHQPVAKRIAHINGRTGMMEAFNSAAIDIFHLPDTLSLCINKYTLQVHLKLVLRTCIKRLPRMHRTATKVCTELQTNVASERARVPFQHLMNSPRHLQSSHQQQLDVITP